MAMIDVLFAAFGAFGGLLAGFVLGWAFMQGKLAAAKQDIAGAVAKSEFDALVNEKAMLAGRLTSMQEASEKLENEMRDIKGECTEFHDRAINAEKQLALVKQAMEAQSVEMKN